MKLHILGSSSKGNGYALVDSQGNTLLLECGIKFSEVQKELDFNVSEIKGLFVSHAHLDHSRYIGQYASYGIDVYSNIDVISKRAVEHAHRMNELKPRIHVDIFPFSVYCFDVVHDVPTLGFMIQHPEMGVTVFATDTYYLPYTFKGVNHWLIEANYDEEMLDARSNQKDGNIALRNRIKSSHMGISNLVRMLKANDMKNTKNIVLTHLSDINSHERNFIKTITEEFGKPVHIADPGKIINLNLTTF